MRILQYSNTADTNIHVKGPSSNHRPMPLR